MLRHRYRRIVFFFARLLSAFLWWDVVLPRIGFSGWSKATRSRRLKKGARAYRNLAIQLGGVMIKVGQFLSSRVDVLPPEFTDELAGLQDEVPAENFDEIRKVAEDELGMTLEERFIEFDHQPMAAASLGQVHHAVVDLESSDQTIFHVVVKIQRPQIEKIIATDMAALRTVGYWLRRYRPISRRADVLALLDEFTRVLYEEIDYLAEGRNAETFAENFRGDKGIRVPKVLWPYTTRRVLTLENVLAIKINDYAAIEAAGLDRKAVASRLLDTYLKQIFEDGFFHADPHPGNLFVYPPTAEESNVGNSELRMANFRGGTRSESSTGRAKNQEDWQLTFVDFGMVGHVSPTLRQGLREMLIAVGTRDAARLVHSYQLVGVLLPGADLDLLKKADEKVFEQFWGKNMTELTSISHAEIGELMSEFRELVYTLPFQVPQDIIFLARCVGILSGMCTGLDPEFNVWQHLAPFARKVMAAEAQGVVNQLWVEQALAWGRSFLSVPMKLNKVLSKLESGEMAVRAPELSRQITRLELAIRQLVIGLVFFGLLLSGTQLFLANMEPWWQFMYVGSGICILWMILIGRRVRR